MNLRIGNEILLITNSNATTEEKTVMVPFEYTHIAHSAVVRSWWTVLFAPIAEVP